MAITLPLMTSPEKVWPFLHAAKASRKGGGFGRSWAFLADNAFSEYDFQLRDVFRLRQMTFIPPELDPNPLIKRGWDRIFAKI
jgi:hypothetical protein